jgi:hypothetical protein
MDRRASSLVPIKANSDSMPRFGEMGKRNGRCRRESPHLRTVGYPAGLRVALLREQVGFVCFVHRATSNVENGFLPEIGESFGKRLHPACGNIIEPLLDSQDRLLPFLAKPAKCLDDDILARCISPRRKFLFDKGFKFRWKLDSHEFSSLS